MEKIYEEVFNSSILPPKVLRDLLKSTGFLIVPNSLIHITKDIPAAFVLSKLMSLDEFFEKEKTEDGFFYYTKEKLQQDFYMSRCFCDSTINKLKELKFIETKLMGLPAKTYFRIDYKFVGFQLSSLTGSYKLDCSPSLSSNIDYNIDNNIGVSSKEETRGVPPQGSGSMVPSLNKRDRSKPIDFTPPEPPPPPRKVPLYIQEYINAWTNMGLRIPGVDTKSYGQMVARIRQLISGDFGPPFHGMKIDIYAWEKAIENFCLALDNDYDPHDKQYLRNTNLFTFIYNPYVTNGNGKSLLFHYMNYTPTLLNKVEDKYPTISNSILARYRKEVLGGSNGSLSAKDLEYFYVASNRLMEFFEDNRKVIQPFFARTGEEKVELFWSALKSVNREITDVKIYFLGTKHFFTLEFPRYLEKQGVFTKVFDRGLRL